MRLKDERHPPRRLFFLLPTKERTKENCRCCDAADPRLRGCTPLRTPIRKSEGPLATRTQYYCSRLTPTGLPPLLSRVFPRTPVVVNFRLFVGAAYMRPANLPPHPISPSPPCRGRACPARNLPPSPTKPTAPSESHFGEGGSLTFIYTLNGAANYSTSCRAA